MRIFFYNIIVFFLKCYRIYNWKISKFKKKKPFACIKHLSLTTLAREN